MNIIRRVLFGLYETFAIASLFVSIWLAVLDIIDFWDPLIFVSLVFLGIILFGYEKELTNVHHK